MVDAACRPEHRAARRRQYGHFRVDAALWDLKAAPRHAYGVGAGHLEADLRATLKGEVRFDPGSRALYSTD